MVAKGPAQVSPGRIKGVVGTPSINKVLRWAVPLIIHSPARSRESAVIIRIQWAGEETP